MGTLGGTVYSGGETGLCVYCRDLCRPHAINEETKKKKAGLPQGGTAREMRAEEEFLGAEE